MVLSSQPFAMAPLQEVGPLPDGWQVFRHNNGKVYIWAETAIFNVVLSMDVENQVFFASADTMRDGQPKLTARGNTDVEAVRALITALRLVI